MITHSRLDVREPVAHSIDDGQGGKCGAILEAKDKLDRDHRVRKPLGAGWGSEQLLDSVLVTVARRWRAADE